jgi:hypothetical protein
MLPSPTALLYRCSNAAVNKSTAVPLYQCCCHQQHCCTAVAMLLSPTALLYRFSNAAVTNSTSVPL